MPIFPSHIAKPEILSISCVIVGLLCFVGHVAAYIQLELTWELLQDRHPLSVARKVLGTSIFFSELGTCLLLDVHHALLQLSCLSELITCGV